MNNLKKKWLIILAIGAMLLVILACGSTTPAAPQAPTATAGPSPTPTLRPYLPSPDKGVMHPIADVSTGALNIANQTISSRMTTNAWLLGIGICLLIIAASVWIFPVESMVFVVIAAIVFGLWGGIGAVGSKISSTVDTVGHSLSDKAITDGVAQVQKLQATNYQYFHANIIQLGMSVLNCQRTVNYKDDCGNNAPQYEQYEEINVYYTTDEHCSTDSDGHESCYTTTTKHWDDELTPRFDQVVRYYIVPDTKARYLSEEVYHQKCLGDDNVSIIECPRGEDGTINHSEDKHKPVIYLHDDWRAPQDVNAHRYKGGTYMPALGTYNNHVSDSWATVEQSKNTGGQVYDATFIGPYYNWGFAAGSPLFEPYTGHYQDLLRLAALPMPDGVVFNTTNAFGKQVQLQTSLKSSDGDLAVLFNPIITVGSCFNGQQLAGYDNIAMQLQGDFGPHKQGSLRWFFVCDSIVNKLGGMANVITALKAYERDVNVWGLFSMPQNLVFMVTSVSDDGKYITGRGMETGMPAGNVLVKQEIAASIPTGQTLPLTPENVFGVFNGNYVQTQGNALEYKYSDLTQAGGTIGMLYKTDPNYVAPDPSSKDCVLPVADHPGFIRYSMCNNLYLQSSIQINQDGYDFIMAQVLDTATKSVSVFGYWMFLLFAVVCLVGSLIGKANEQ